MSPALKGSQSTQQRFEHGSQYFHVVSRDPGPTPSVGHVTGDMKRRESNETPSNTAK